MEALRGFKTLWENILSDLEKNHNIQTTIYRASTKLVTTQEGYCILVSSNFVRNQIEKKLSLIKTMLQEHDILDITIKVDETLMEDVLDEDDDDEDEKETNTRFDATPNYPRPNSIRTKTPSKKTLNISKSSLELIDSESMSLDAKMTFPNFIASSINSMNVSRAKNFASGDSDLGLFIFGKVGMGKTHLMTAVANHIQQNFTEKTYFMLTASNFMDLYFDFAKKKKIDDFKRYLKSLDFLFIDDIQSLRGRAKPQELLFETYNHLRNNKKSLVFTCDVPPSQLTDMHDRLSTRFSESVALDLKYPDQNTRYRILLNQVKLFNGKHSSLKYDDEVLEELASYSLPSVRDLIGAFNNLWTYAQVMQDPNICISLDMLHIADVQSSLKMTQQVSEDRIFTCTALKYNVRKEDIFSRSRAKSIALARHVASYCLRDIMKITLTEIAAKTGRKDHTTADHSIKKIEELMENDPSFKLEIEYLIREITEINS